MGASERGRAAGATPDDENNDDATQDRPCDPLPPGFVDLGDGDLLTVAPATADDCRAAAAWLHRHYPERSQDPAHGQIGPIFNMGYELTREARAGMPHGWSMAQRAVVLVLADICNDRTRRQPQHLDVSERLFEELDIPPGTLRNILTSLAEAGFEFRVAVGKDRRGRPMFAHRGRAVDYQFPEIPPRAPKGAHGGAPKAVDNPEKGAPIDAPLESKGALLDAPSAGMVHAGVLNGARRRAPQTTKTPNDQKMTPTRVGDPIADKLGHNQDQGQDPSVAKWQNRPLPDGSIENTLDASQPATCTTAGSLQTAREGEPGGTGGAGAPLSESAQTAASDATTQAVDPAEHQQREIARLEEWMREQGTSRDPAEDFAAFWVAYPRKVNRPKALDAWQSVIDSGADCGQVVDAAYRFAGGCRRSCTEERFIPHPAKWLIDKRWLDEPEPRRRTGFWEN